MNQTTYVSQNEILEVMQSFEGTRPENARLVITKSQKIWLALLAVIVLALLIAKPALALSLVALCVLGFTTQFVFKGLTAGDSFGKLIKVSDETLAAMNPRHLPLYTILLPLRGEESVVHQLVNSMSQLDYPTNHLQIILLLEENDPRTVEAVARVQLPNNFEVVVLADAGPRTKPKACTVGLEFVKGEFCVIFDAEDHPEPDQLKKVVAAYRADPNQSVWCIQAKLEYHNDAQNLLTRWFSGEYITHFNLTLPSLARRNLLLPLGGTSNHFRTEKLFNMGGWDPYNVTEDLDLGIVIARNGGLVKMIDSVTWEEANARPFGRGAWISQRSRWIKGHMQSWLVHMRHPWKLFLELGPANWLLFHILILGSPLALLMGPVFLGTTVLYMISRGFELSALQLAIESLFPTGVYYLSVASFIAGNFTIMYMVMAGCILRERYGNVKYMLIAPIYWLMMSWAAWKAAKQLVTKPHYWEKTSHGHQKK